MHRPFFSIVVPCFNRPRLIGACVASVMAQSCEDWELIVVDDASDPPLGGGVALPRDPRITVLRNGKRLGPGASRNRGAAVARGAYIHFLDSDDRLACAALATFAELAADGHDVLVGGWDNVTAEGFRCRQIPARPYRDDLANCVAGGWATGAVAIRAAICPKISETRMPWEMAEAYLAAAGHAGSVGYVQQPVAMIAQASALSLTVAHDHFEPLRAGRFWAEMKRRHATSDERRSAFDKRLFEAGLSVRRRGERKAALGIFGALDRGCLASYPWYEALKPIWFADKMGFERGLDLHDRLSRIKQRCWPHA